MALFIGFGLKAATSMKSKFSCIVKTFEGEQPTEEEKNTKDEKSGRGMKKQLFCEHPEMNRLAFKEAMSLRPHDRVYLSAAVTKPLIAIPTEPPELG
ncbi:hypothetical protein [Pedobacter sp. SYP-B3415]|uniref:hypothetical protein n=1 Tax=Pedobacter sp. SYP-B3415 TaxID=2496641 RepID=UPI00101C56A8|nr:hypothetical protein [Pedobacter sp. SYP-B3415]